jgi:hypothetical protein
LPGYEPVRLKKYYIVIGGFLCIISARLSFADRVIYPEEKYDAIVKTIRRK